MQHAHEAEALRERAAASEAGLSDSEAGLSHLRDDASRAAAEVPDFDTES